MTSYPPELRQQVIDVIHQQANRALDYLEATEIADAVLPIIARGLDRAYHEEWCSAAGPGCDCRFRIERDQLRQANANNLEGWAQDRAGLERRYLHAEQERDHWKQEAESRRERKVLCETLEAERDELRDEREDSLSRWHQIAESEADVKRLTEERDALRRLVRWVWEVPNFSLDDVPDDLRATLDAALTETPNE